MRRDRDDFIVMQNAPGPKRLLWTLETARNVQRRTVGMLVLWGALNTNRSLPYLCLSPLPQLTALVLFLDLYLTVCSRTDMWSVLLCSTIKFLAGKIEVRRCKNIRMYINQILHRKAWMHNYILTSLLSFIAAWIRDIA